MFEIIVLRSIYTWGNSSVALFYCSYSSLILLCKSVYSTIYFTNIPKQFRKIRNSIVLLKISVLTNGSVESVVGITGDEELHGISFSRIQRSYRAGFAMVAIFRSFWCTMLGGIPKLSDISENKLRIKTPALSCRDWFPYLLLFQIFSHFSWWFYMNMFFVCLTCTYVNSSVLFIMCLKWKVTF